LKKLILKLLLIMVVVSFSFTVGLTQANIPHRIINKSVDRVPIIDPARGSGGASNIPLLQIYDMLVFPNADGSMKPWLAISWKVDDEGLNYTFNLRKGVKFHNGDELTAEDVVFSMKRTMSLGEAFAYVYTGTIKDVAEVDKYTVKFTLQRPFSAFINSLARFYVVNKKQVLKNIVSGTYGDMGDYGKDWMQSHDAGSGPYMVKEIVQQSHLYLERYDGFWGGWKENAPDALKFIATTEPITIRTMLQNQELELTDQNQTVENLKAISQIPGVEIGTYFMGTQLNMVLNNKKPPTDDVNFRKAISYLFDYDMIIKFIYPQSSQSVGPIEARTAGHDPNLYQYSLDLEKAKEYLQKSKYGDKLDKYPLDLVVNSNIPDHEKIALSFQAQAAKVGLKVNISKVPWMTITERVTKPESTPNMVGISIAPAYNEAGSMLETRYHSKNVGKWTTAEWLQDKEIDAMIEDALSTADQKERFDKYYKIQEKLVNDIVPCVWLIDTAFRVAYQGGYMKWPIIEEIKQGKKASIVVEGAYYYFHDFELYPEKMMKK
jgi:peptide/nickel transport system substrate-binding protein